MNIELLKEGKFPHFLVQLGYIEKNKDITKRSNWTITSYVFDSADADTAFTKYEYVRKSFKSYKENDMVAGCFFFFKKAEVEGTMTNIDWASHIKEKKDVKFLNRVAPQYGEPEVIQQAQEELNPDF